MEFPPKRSCFPLEDFDTALDASRDCCTAIRRNMTTRAWKDVYALIHSHEMTIETQEGELKSLPTSLAHVNGKPSFCG